EKLAQAQAKLPLIGTDWQIQTALTHDRLLLHATPPSWFTGELNEIRFFPLQPLLIEAAAPQTFTRTSTGYALEIPRATAAPPTTIQGVLVTPTGWRGASSEHALAVNARVEPVENLPSSGLNLGTALGLALIGGLLLNLMPCVLPVLSIKVLGFVRQTGATWQYGVAFTAGVLVSVWVLAGLLLVLRAGGEQLGWGFQLQSPAFLVVLVAVLFLFGLNLFGVFEVGTALTRAGELVPSSGRWGSFGSGVLATVVATPCSAPYMGSALGFALTQPTWAALAIFTALGLGMALPYLLLSFFPQLLKFVPKPGAWMETFKQAMGFLLMGSAVWLLWVLGLQTGVTTLIRVLVALVLLGSAAWVLGKWGGLMQPTGTRWVARGLALVALIVGLGFALGDLEQAQATQTTSSVDELPWEVYTQERVAQLRQTRTPVFIDFTAAWCLSCQVNERIALNSAEVRAAFQKQGVVLLKADWTTRDSRITQALAQFGRSGVPLYVLYGPAGTQVLPEVLTPGIVIAALAKLG
ncbi:protein-disulfide reductase DsbD, partial [Candidatus Cyanaurora vandensis]|uniref:protein-disulfide reductase DsbD family protein n=1 Tax=Candidatus Cyanaurora vandensis TaxID=2714958 RepID=UPI00257A9B78